MATEVKQKKVLNFQELGKDEKILLLRAFDYDINSIGEILDRTGNVIKSDENPAENLTVSNAALIPGSLKVIDSSPTSIARLIREMEKENASRS